MKREYARTYLIHGVTGSGKTEVYMEGDPHGCGAGETGYCPHSRDRADISDCDAFLPEIRRQGIYYEFPAVGRGTV